MAKVFEKSVDSEHKAVIERLVCVYRGWYTSKAVQRARDGSAMRSLCWHNDPFVHDHDGSRGAFFYTSSYFAKGVRRLLKWKQGTPAHTRSRWREGWLWERHTHPTPFHIFSFPPANPNNPFLSVMLRFRFPTVQRITEQRTVAGAMCWWCMLGGQEKGVSIVTPRQWKDWTNGLCRAWQCVCEGAWSWAL